MRLRARHIHHLETLTDNIVGLLLNFAVTIVVFNWWLGQDISFTQNLKASAAFFVVAYIRKFTLRRWFSAWIGRIYARREAEEAIPAPVYATQEEALARMEPIVTRNAEALRILKQHEEREELARADVLVTSAGNGPV